MHGRWMRISLAVALLLGGGSALAGHVTQVDPATVPTGFLATHSAVTDVPVSSLARAVTPRGADFLVQHVRLPANTPTAWHTHPGPALVSVVKGSLVYEDGAAPNHCRRLAYGPGQGFVDRGFGHVHRAIAGPDGVDFYVTYVLPRGSETHVVPADAPAECA